MSMKVFREVVFGARCKILLLTLLFGLTTISNFSPVRAIENSSAQTNDLKKSLTACRALKSDQKRLICFDQIVFDIASQTQQKEKADISDFGSGDLPRKRRQNIDNSSMMEQGSIGPKGLTAKVISGGQTESGLYFFNLENGQTWRQVRSERVKGYVPKLQGKSVFIRKGTLGSHFLKLEGRRSAIKVKRIR